MPLSVTKYCGLYLALNKSNLSLLTSVYVRFPQSLHTNFSISAKRSSSTQVDAPMQSNATTNCYFFSIIWNCFTLPSWTKELVKSHPVKACKAINALQAAVPIAFVMVLSLWLLLSSDPAIDFFYNGASIRGPARTLPAKWRNYPGPG